MEQIMKVVQENAAKTNPDKKFIAIVLEDDSGWQFV